jgi:hypothetical protein
MSGYREVLESVLVNGTPEQCIGCHTPFLRADHLALQVLDGALTQEEATAQLRESLEQHCRYGRAAVRSAYDTVESKCMYASFPSIAGMDSYPAELMSWDEYVHTPDTPEAAA